MENGLLFHAGDKKELECKVELLINDEKLREKLGKAAYCDAKENYEWNKSFEKYRKALREIKK